MAGYIFLWFTNWNWFIDSFGWVLYFCFTQKCKL